MSHALVFRRTLSYPWERSTTRARFAPCTLELRAVHSSVILRSSSAAGTSEPEDAEVDSVHNLATHAPTPWVPGEASGGLPVDMPAPLLQPRPLQESRSRRANTPLTLTTAAQHQQHSATAPLLRQTSASTSVRTSARTSTSVRPWRKVLGTLSMPDSQGSAASPVLPRHQNTRQHRLERRRLASTSAPNAVSSPASPQGPHVASSSWQINARSSPRGSGLQLPAQGRLLRRDEEAELTDLVKDMYQLEQIRGELVSLLQRQPSTEEWARAAGMGDEHRLFLARLQAGHAGCAQLLQHNRKLVAHVVKWYLGRGVPFEDLLGEGIVKGLLRAALRFDPSKGYKFSTYAVYWIRQALSKCVSSEVRIVRVPHNLDDMVRSVAKAHKLLGEKLGHDPSTEQLAREIEMPVGRVRELLAIGGLSSRWHLLLSNPDDSESGVEHWSKESEDDDRQSFVEETLVRHEVLGMINRHVPNKRHSAILKLSCEGKTRLELAKEFDVSEERIRQILAKATLTMSGQATDVAGEYRQSASLLNALPSARRGMQRADKS